MDGMAGTVVPLIPKLRKRRLALLVVVELGGFQIA
jgi:hypothetical protein